MILITNPLRARLLAHDAAGADIDHFPVVKLFDPKGAATSLLSELDADGDTLFGLCDLGFGFPELGSVSLAELASVKGPLGLGIERDLHFQARFPISVHAEAARILRPRHRGRATAAAGSRRPIKAPFRASARHGGTAAPIGAKPSRRVGLRPPRRGQPGRRRYFAAKSLADERGEGDPLPCAIMEDGDDADALEAS